MKLRKEVGDVREALDCLVRDIRYWNDVLRNDNQVPLAIAITESATIAVMLSHAGACVEQLNQFTQTMATRDQGEHEI